MHPGAWPVPALAHAFTTALTAPNRCVCGRLSSIGDVPYSLQLAAQPAASVRLSKRLMKAPGKELLRAHMQREGDLFFERLSSPEAREAMSAFMEKRKPDFSQFD